MKIVTKKVYLTNISMFCILPKYVLSDDVIISLLSQIISMEISDITQIIIDKIGVTADMARDALHHHFTNHT